MPSSGKRAQAIVNAASAALTLDLVEELAEPLAKHMFSMQRGTSWLER